MAHQLSSGERDRYLAKFKSAWQATYGQSPKQHLDDWILSMQQMERLGWNRHIGILLCDHHNFKICYASSNSQNILGYSPKQ